MVTTLTRFGSRNAWTGETADGTLVLVSYHTPVCALTPDGRIVETATRYGVTTTHQISAFLSHDGPVRARLGQEGWERAMGSVDRVSQADLDAVAAGLPVGATAVRLEGKKAVRRYREIAGLPLPPAAPFETLEDAATFALPPNVQVRGAA